MVSTHSKTKPIFSLFHFLILFCSLLIIQACGDPETDLSSTIKRCLRDKEGISEAEWQTINDLIESESSLAANYGSEDAIRAKIDGIAKEMSESPRNPIPYPITIHSPNASPQASSQGPRAFNIYLENSGSMFGYFDGNTAFRDALFDLCSRIKRRGEAIDFYFVNDKIHPVQGEVDDFMKYLKPAQLRKIGNTSSSNVSDVLNLVLDSVMATNTPAILTSDFIFSLSKGQNIENQLTTQKYGITNIIVDQKLKENNYGFLVIQGQSMFNGMYYDYKNRPTKITQNRPYYTWIIAPVDQLLKFEQAYDIQGLKGYMNHALIFDTRGLPTPYFSALPESEKIGSFRKKDRSSNVVTEINSIEYSRRKEKEFQFAIAADLGNIPIEESFLLQSDNYTVASSKRDQFEIEVVPD